MRKKMKKYYIIFFVLIIGMVLPWIVNLGISSKLPIVFNGVGNNDWIGFWGSYFGSIYGAIIGGVVAFNIAKKQINSHKKEIEKNNNDKMIISKFSLIIEKVNDLKAQMEKNNNYFFKNRSFIDENYKLFKSNYNDTVNYIANLKKEINNNRYLLEEFKLYDKFDFKELYVFLEKLKVVLNLIDDIVKDSENDNRKNNYKEANNEAIELCKKQNYEIYKYEILLQKELNKIFRGKNNIECDSPEEYYNKMNYNSMF